MREITPYLFATEVESTGFLKTFRRNSFFLKRECGNNFVIYNSTNLEFDEFWLRENGGVSRQYLSHNHEASSTCRWLQNTFENGLYIHQFDAIGLREIADVSGTFNSSVKIGEDFEIITTPGHTLGSTCFYWTSPDGTRVMFTGDSLVPNKRGEWMLFLDEQTDQTESEMLDSLNRLYHYNVDLVVPRGSEGEFEWKFTRPGEWEYIIDKAIVRLRTKLMHISKRI